MSEWPPAPRLRDALQHLASKAATDTGSAERVAELLSDDETRTEPDPPPGTAESGSDQNIDPPDIAPDRTTPDEPVRDHTRRRRTRLAVAAAVAVTIATGTLILDRANEPTTVTATADPTATNIPSPQPTPTPPAPAQRFYTHCESASSEPTPMLLQAGQQQLDIGVAGDLSVAGESGPTGSTVFVVTDPSGWTTEAQRVSIHDPVALARGTVYVPGDFTQAQSASVAQSLLERVCAAPSYLIGTTRGTDAAIALACADTGGSGFQGYVLEDPALPPPQCQLHHPTILLTSTMTRDFTAWEAYMGCTEPHTETDDNANQITTYANCTDTLIVLRTSTDDPWQVTFNDTRTPDYVLGLLHSIPR